MIRTSQAGIDFLKDLEGFSATAYPDAQGYSIGYGTYIDTLDEQDLLTRTITRQEGEDLLRRDLSGAEQAVNDAIRVPLTQPQFDALVSFAYNLGRSQFIGGTLDDLINRSASDEEIKSKWREYRMSNGQVSAALVKRREAEIHLYFTPAGAMYPGSKKKP